MVVSAVDRPLIGYGSSSIAGHLDSGTGNQGILSRLATRFSTTYTNRGVSGSVSADALAAVQASTTAERARYTLIWTGKNDANGTVTPQTTLNNIAAIVDLLTGPYLVLGHFVDIGSGSYATNRIIAQNAALASAYGDRYIDVRGYLASDQLWTDTGITPTSQDLTNQASGIKPPSVSADNFHLNAAGYTGVAKMVGDYIVANSGLGSRTLEVAEVTLTTTNPNPTSVLQVMDVTVRVDVSNSAPTVTGQARVGTRRVEAVLPDEVVELTATITGNYTSTSWTVDPASTPVQLAGGATVRTFMAPPVTGDEDQVIVHVTATGPAGTSAAHTFNILIVATTEWYLGAGSVWTPYELNRAVA